MQNGDDPNLPLGVEVAHEATMPLFLRVPAGVEVEVRRGVETRGATGAFRGVPHGVDDALHGVDAASGVRPRCLAVSVLALQALGVPAGEEDGQAAWGELAAQGEAASMFCGCPPEVLFKVPEGTWIYWDLRRLLISLEAVAMDKVENDVARCRKSGLTQNISAIPQPGLKYSHKHLLSTLCRRSDSSSVFVCSLRSNLFNDESEVFNTRADFRPCSEGFSCSFSVPARSTSVSAPMLLLTPPPSPPLSTSAGF